MDLRKRMPHLVVLILAISAVPLFFGGRWFRPFPDVNLYSGQLEFSAGRAMADLRTLAEEYPNRQVGTRADRLSAQWVQARLKEIGLDVRIEEFTCLVKEASIPPDMTFSVPAASLTYATTGYNVVGISPGRSPEAVVVGAQRDVSDTIQGTENNASGTAAMIELARALSRGDHCYTYIFVSYDGEEAGLRGSEAFARSHGDLAVKLAISLDMVAWKEANTVGFYPFVSEKSASPLWTVVLARDLAASKGLLPFYPGARDQESRASLVTFWRAGTQRLAGAVSTGTGPFVDRGIPSLGLMAMQVGPDGKGRHAPIHSYWDDVEEVSETAMERTGKFAEQYAMSLELNSFKGSMNSRSYFVSGDEFLAPQAMGGFAIYCCALAISPAVLSWLEATAVGGGAEPAPGGGCGPGRPEAARRTAARWATAARSFARFLRSEILWICLTLGLAMASAAFPALIPSLLGRRLSLTWFKTLSAGASLGGTVALICLRARRLSRGQLPYHEITAWQKLLLNGVFALVFAALAAFMNPFAALRTALFPLVVFGRVSFRTEAARLLWSLAASAWSVASTIAMGGNLARAAFDPLTGRAVLVDFLSAATWMIAAVYVLSVPRRGLRSENRQTR